MGVDLLSRRFREVGIVSRRIDAVALLSAVVMLGGCAIAGRNAAESQLATCNVIMSDPGLNPIQSRTALWDAREITFPMLAYEQTVTEEEKRALELWGQRLQECRKGFLSVASQHFGQILPPLQSAYFQTDAVIAKLFNSQITWAKFNQERGRIFAEYMSAANAIDQSNAAARRAMGQALQNYGNAMANRPQQTYIPPPLPTYQPPRQTNCTTYGNQTTCTTQ